jgi:hypothetical protein
VETQSHKCSFLYGIFATYKFIIENLKSFFFEKCADIVGYVRLANNKKKIEKIVDPRTGVQVDPSKF